MKTSLILLTFICFTLVSPGLQGQQLLSSAGANEKSATLQLSWSIGEPMIETYMAGSNTLTQGFQQSRLTITAVDLLSLPGLTVSVYPNPVFTELILEVSEGSSDILSYQLFMMDGKILLHKRVENQTERINMEIYREGTYLLKVFYENNKASKTFKIVKH
jgi:hypothetical protein